MNTLLIMTNKDIERYKQMFITKTLEHNITNTEEVNEFINTIKRLETVISIIINTKPEEFYQELKSIILTEFEKCRIEISQYLDKNETLISNNNDNHLSKYLICVSQIILFIISSITFKLDYYSLAMNCLIKKTMDYISIFIERYANENTKYVSPAIRNKRLKVLHYILHFMSLSKSFTQNIYCHEDSKNSTMIFGSYGKYIFTHLIKVNRTCNKLIVDSSKPINIINKIMYKVMGWNNEMSKFVKGDYLYGNMKLEKFFRLHFNLKLVTWKSISLPIDKFKKKIEICRICDQKIPLQDFFLHINYCKEQKVFCEEMKMYKDKIEKLTTEFQRFINTNISNDEYNRNNLFSLTNHLNSIFSKIHINEHNNGKSNRNKKKNKNKSKDILNAFLRIFNYEKDISVNLYENKITCFINLFSLIYVSLNIFHLFKKGNVASIELNSIFASLIVILIDKVLSVEFISTIKASQTKSNKNAFNTNSKTQNNSTDNLFKSTNTVKEAKKKFLSTKNVLSSIRNSKPITSHNINEDIHNNTNTKYHNQRISFSSFFDEYKMKLLRLSSSPINQSRQSSLSKESNHNADTSNKKVTPKNCNYNKRRSGYKKSKTIITKNKDIIKNYTRKYMEPVIKEKKRKTVLAPFKDGFFMLDKENTNNSSTASSEIANVEQNKTSFVLDDKAKMKKSLFCGSTRFNNLKYLYHKNEEKKKEQEEQLQIFATDSEEDDEEEDDNDNNKSNTNSNNNNNKQTLTNNNVFFSNSEEEDEEDENENNLNDSMIIAGNDSDDINILPKATNNSNSDINSESNEDINNEYDNNDDNSLNSLSETDDLNKIINALYDETFPVKPSSKLFITFDTLPKTPPDPITPKSLSTPKNILLLPPSIPQSSSPITRVHRSTHSISIAPLITLHPTFTAEEQNDSSHENVPQVISTTSIKDFQLVIPLAKGGYGKVDLYKKRTTGDIFAVKTVNIKSMKDKKLYSTLKTETQILNEINSDYIVNCYYIIKEKSNIYYVMEYMKGGDLFSLLSSVYLMKSTIQLITAEVLLSLFYLHSKNITHRDIKPENILINDEGHFKLTDFGLSQCENKNNKYAVYHGTDDVLFINEESSENNSNEELKKKIVGTLNYMAPENFTEEYEITFAVDYWALGVLIYELYTFKVPFDAECTNAIKANIINMKINWEFIDCDETRENYDNVDNAIDLIKKFLVKNPYERWGDNEFEKIKEHSFFDGFNWNGIKSIREKYMIDYVRKMLEKTNAKIKEKGMRSKKKEEGEIKEEDEGDENDGNDGCYYERVDNLYQKSSDVMRRQIKTSKVELCEINNYSILDDLK